MKQDKYDKKIIFYSIVVIFILFFNSINSVGAVASLSLIPNSGIVGSTITASGSGLTGYSQVTHNFITAQTGLFGNLYTQQFAGLTVGANITQLGFKVALNGVTGTQVQTESFTTTS